MNNADDIPQSERRRVMANDRKVREAATYHSVAQSVVYEERGGRYATESGKQTVIGSAPIAYPQQPSTSPWHSDSIGTEPPLRYSVEEMEPVGEPHERTASATSLSVTARAQAGVDVKSIRRRGIIPNPIDQNPWAHWRSPMDMMRQGWSTSLFHAAQQWSTRSS